MNYLFEACPVGPRRRSRLCIHDQGRYAEAEPLYSHSLATLEKALGSEHPDVATGLNNLALLYQVQSRYADAEPLYKRALVATFAIG